MAAKRGFLSTILNGDAVGTKVSVSHRQGGRSSEVVVKRGSTVCIAVVLLWLQFVTLVRGNLQTIFSKITSL